MKKSRLEEQITELKEQLRKKDAEICSLQKTIQAMREQETRMAALFRGAQTTQEGRRSHALESQRLLGF